MLDLEDAVAPAAKVESRDRLVAALQAEGQPVWFRKIELMSLEKK